MPPIYLNQNARMQYREQYAKKMAGQMYFEGKDVAAVAKMLQEEGAGEKAIGFAEDYYRSYLFVRNEQQKQKAKTAGMYTTVGAVFVIMSVLYAGLMYIALDNGNTVVFSGVLLAGVVLLIKGYIDKKQLIRQ